MTGSRNQTGNWNKPELETKPEVDLKPGVELKPAVSCENKMLLWHKKPEVTQKYRKYLLIYCYNLFAVLCNHT